MVPENIYNPIYAIAVIFIVFVFSWIISYLVPFYRHELAIEDRARLTPLDGLRGIPCFAVMMHHAVVTYAFLGTKIWAVPLSIFYALLGQTSVALFFCVTAFLFWTSVHAKNGKLPSWPFLRARIFRIVPLYLFSTLLALAIVLPQLHFFSFSMLRQFAHFGLMGFRPWGSIGGIDVNLVDAGVTWTLQYEWGFYLLLPAMALIVRDGGSRRLWFVAFGAIVLFGAGPILFFLPGILAVYAAQDANLVVWLRSRYASLSVLATALIFPLVTGNGYGLKALVLTTVIFVPIACGNNVFGILTLRGLRLMGIISYSVYLLHGTCLYLAHPILIRAKECAASAFIYWACIAGCACIALIVSIFTYRLVEWPFIRIEKRMRHGPPT